MGEKITVTVEYRDEYIEVSRLINIESTGINPVNDPQGIIADEANRAFKDALKTVLAAHGMTVNF